MEKIHRFIGPIQLTLKAKGASHVTSNEENLYSKTLNSVINTSKT